MNTRAIQTSRSNGAESVVESEVLSDLAANATVRRGLNAFADRSGMVVRLDCFVSLQPSQTVAGGRARLNGSRDEEGEGEWMTDLVLAGALGLGPAALKAGVLGSEDVAAAGGALPVAGADVAAAAAATAAAPAAAAVAAAASATLLVFSQSHPMHTV